MGALNGSRDAMKAPLPHRSRIAASAALAIACSLVAVTAFAQGAPTVRVIEEPAVVQPPPFATRGETVVVPRTRIEIDEGKKSPAAEPRPRKKSKSAAAAKEPAAQSSKPDAARPSEAKSSPPPLPPAREIAAPNDAGKPKPAAKSKILSGDALGRKQRKTADNTDGED